MKCLHGLCGSCWQVDVAWDDCMDLVAAAGGWMQLQWFALSAMVLAPCNSRNPVVQSFDAFRHPKIEFYIRSRFAYIPPEDSGPPVESKVVSIKPQNQHSCALAYLSWSWRKSAVCLPA